MPPRPHDLTASLEFSEEAESFHDLLSCAFSPAHLRAPRGEPSAPAMSAEVASGQASTRASAPGVADGPALDSLSLFETTARVTAVSFASARHDDATRRATRKRARASSSPERPHATTSSPAPSRVTREPLSSPRDATARAEPSSRRNGSGDRASTANANGGALSRFSAWTWASPRLRRENGSRVWATTRPTPTTSSETDFSSSPPSCRCSRRWRARTRRAPSREDRSRRRARRRKKKRARSSRAPRYAESFSSDTGVEPAT